MSRGGAAADGSGPARPSRRTGVRWVAVAVVCLLPLAVIVAVTRSSLAGWGTGFVVTGVWMLLLALGAQARRAVRERAHAADYPGPAARRLDVSAVAEAMLAAAGVDRAGGPDWTQIRLVVDDGGRRMTLRHPDGAVDPVTVDDAALGARIDQLEEAVGRTAAAARTMTVWVARNGDAAVGVE